MNTDFTIKSHYGIPTIFSKGAVRQPVGNEAKSWALQNQLITSAQTKRDRKNAKRLSDASFCKGMRLAAKV